MGVAILNRSIVSIQCFGEYDSFDHQKLSAMDVEGHRREENPQLRGTHVGKYRVSHSHCF